MIYVIGCITTMLACCAVSAANALAGVVALFIVPSATQLLKKLFSLSHEATHDSRFTCFALLAMTLTSHVFIQNLLNQ